VKRSRVDDPIGARISYSGRDRIAARHIKLGFSRRNNVMTLIILDKVGAELPSRTD
jgi:hypothetical protein